MGPVNTDIDIFVKPILESTYWLGNKMWMLVLTWVCQSKKYSKETPGNSHENVDYRRVFTISLSRLCKCWYWKITHASDTISDANRDD